MERCLNWRERGDALRLDEWVQRARAIAAQDHRSGVEHFLYLHAADLEDFVARFNPMEADGDHPGAIAQWRFGYSVADDNGSDIWMLMRVPIARPGGGEPAHVNAAVKIDHIADERVDDARASDWGSRALLRALSIPTARVLFLERASGVVEIQGMSQSRGQ